MSQHRKSFLFDPNKNSIFYLFLFIALAALGLQLYKQLNGDYSIIGSVASFLGLFAAFQSWKAADEGSKKTDEALGQMHQIAHETRQLVESSNNVETQISKAVTTISDATRQIYKGFQPVMTAIRDFLDDAKDSEYMALMTDSAAIGMFNARHHQPQLNEREIRSLTDRVHELLIERVGDSREFYMATLGAELYPNEFPPRAEKNPLYYYHSEVVWKRFHPGEDFPEKEWTHHRQIHNATLRQIEETFDLFADHEDQKAMGVPPTMTVSVLPLQFYIRYDAEANEPYRALILFLGQYNLDQVTDARAMETTDPELVRTFISMFESITNLDEHDGYQKLRIKWPV